MKTSNRQAWITQSRGGDELAWSGMRYEVRLAGFGVLGQDLATLMLFGAFSSLVRPVGYELPMSPFEKAGDKRLPRLVVLLSSSETLDQMLSACRLVKAQGDEDYVLAVLISDLDTPRPEQQSLHGEIRQTADITLRFPYEETSLRWNRGFKQDPIIQALRAFICPSAWDEYVDFDLNVLRDTFSETAGYVTVAEKGFDVRDEDAAIEFEQFFRDNDLETRCRDAAVFLSIRGVQAIRLNRDLGISQRLSSVMTQPDGLVLSLVKDYGDYSGTTVFVTVITVDRPQDSKLGQHTLISVTSPGQEVCLSSLDIPRFLQSDSTVKEESGNCSTHRTSDSERLNAQLQTHSDDAERWILGALLADSNIWNLVTGWTPRTSIDECCFYSERHRLIFRAIKSLITGDELVSRESVAEWVNHHESIDVTALLEYLDELEMSLVSFYGFESAATRYAYIVRERWLIRQKAAEELRVGAEQGFTDPADQHL